MTERDIDLEARTAALDPSRSFLIQAPAGSGKTGLLVQRYLRLLGTVDVPEQIVAITFTLKAAAEMRTRVVQALRNVEGPPAGASEFVRQTHELARTARERSDELGWNLALHPSRLRVETIDAFCLSLAAQLPLLARAGAELNVTDEPLPLYAAAARRTLGLSDEGNPVGTLLLTLLAHRDNQLLETEALLIEMLGRREQWLPHIAGIRGEELRRRLERALQIEIEMQLRALTALWPEQTWVDTVELAATAALHAQTRATPLAAWRHRTSPPGESHADLELWRGLAALLLTGSDTWRVQLTANHGYPTPAARAAGRELIAVLSRVPQLCDQLAQVRRLPPPQFSTAQWQVAQALFELLLTAAAQLEVVFREAGTVDFPAVNRAAINALGAPEEPRELALALDYRIRHLLVDEFQDTSSTQIQLLEALTAGWVDGDGRTLFCVGDPMQSVYRFRQADVGLFLRTRDLGLSTIRPAVLQLQRNFRSHAGLIDWFNDVFARLLPGTDDLTRGAVRHVASAAGLQRERKPAVHVHCSFSLDERAEAVEVADLIEARYQPGMKKTIGVLVRYRRHVTWIASVLRERKLPFQAIELETLESQPVVRDLMALSRALLHPGDRTAWLALLRAPVCGLTLADLEALISADEHSTCWELLNQSERLQALTSEGKRRAGAVTAVLGHALDKVRRQSLRACVEQTWMSLGGPATLGELRALDDAAAFFMRLQQLEARGGVESGPGFELEFADLYARPDPTAGPQIQLMTIHKAKGLEFDIVVIPRLGDGRQPPNEPLLRWLEIPRAAGEPGLLLAPIGQKGSTRDPLFDYLKQREREQESFERARLLYVAVTRAADELHLFGHVKPRRKGVEEGFGAPEANSLLGPVVAPQFAREFEARKSALRREDIGGERLPVVIRRLTTDWTLPSPPPGLETTGAIARAELSVRPEFDWASETSRRVGTLVHQELELWSRSAELPLANAIRSRRGNYRRRLETSGVPAERLEAAVERVIEALVRTREDARGRWIFSESHRDVRSELGLTGHVDGELSRIVIDRTFVTEGGERWIIDFKTSSHEGAEREAFLDREVERYRPQLERYARLLDPERPADLRVGLYFPLIGGWREWTAGVKSVRPGE